MTNQVDIYKMHGKLITCKSQKLFSGDWELGSYTMGAGSNLDQEQQEVAERQGYEAQRAMDRRRWQCNDWEQEYASTPPSPPDIECQKCVNMCDGWLHLQQHQKGSIFSLTLSPIWFFSEADHISVVLGYNKPCHGSRLSWYPVFGVPVKLSVCPGPQDC